MIRYDSNNMFFSPQPIPKSKTPMKSPKDSYIDNTWWQQRSWWQWIQYKCIRMLYNSWTVVCIVRFVVSAASPVIAQVP